MLSYHRSSSRSTSSCPLPPLTSALPCPIPDRPFPPSLPLYTNYGRVGTGIAEWKLMMLIAPPGDEAGTPLHVGLRAETFRRGGGFSGGESERGSPCC